MIISASRRSDIPALYSDWLIDKLKNGLVLVPNPRNQNRISKVEISPKNVDCIVFWTKNPIPMFDKLKLIDKMGYHYYFHFTLTPYGREIERFLPPKDELISAFINLSNLLGKNRVIWRYDPIFVDKKHNLKWHRDKFSSLCQKLVGKTSQVVVSFLDIYKFTSPKFASMNMDEIYEISADFAKISSKFGIKLSTCVEEIDLSRFGIDHFSCINKDLIEEIVGYPLNLKKDPNQRPRCRCLQSVDIGAYNTCVNGCSYCYATSSEAKATASYKNLSPSSPMITGFPKGDEIITNRTLKSHIDKQLRLF